MSGWLELDPILRMLICFCVGFTVSTIATIIYMRLRR